MPGRKKFGFDAVIDACPVEANKCRIADLTDRHWADIMPYEVRR